MKTWLMLFLCLLLNAAWAGEPAAEKTTAQKPVRLPGVSLAEGVSEVTGVAISPMLGVSVVGAWKWWHTDSAIRAQLPWFCQPWAWGCGLGIIGLCFLKDVLGAAVPALLKKPLDWLELFENKISGLVASTAFIPLVGLAMAEYQRVQPAQGALCTPQALGFATAGAGWEHWLQHPGLTIPLSMMMFGIVWVTSHVVHVLIALSPSGFIDTLLKLFKTAVLSLVATCGLLSEKLGPLPALILCFSILFISLLLVGWSSRLALFGAVMVKDLLTRRREKPGALPQQKLRGFLTTEAAGAPARTYGFLQRKENELVFTYRPWFFLPSRHLPLATTARGELVLVRSLLHTSLAECRDGESRARLVTLLPRYRSLEPEVARLLGGLSVQDSPVIRGFKAARQWLTDLLKNGKRTVINAVAAS